MVPSKPMLCALLLALVWFVPGWARLGACSVSEVLRHYRAVIFQDLQAAEHSILLSIESLGQTLRGAVTGGRHSTLEKAAWTVALRTEAVMRRHCWKPRQRSGRPRTRPVRRRGSRRRLLLRALDTVATCWEKLFALRATATGES